MGTYLYDKNGGEVFIKQTKRVAGLLADGYTTEREVGTDSTEEKDKTINSEGRVEDCNLREFARESGIDGWDIKRFGILREELGIE